MKFSLMVFCFLLTSVVCAAEFEVEGLLVDTSDFKRPPPQNFSRNVFKNSVDEKCRLSYEKFRGESPDMFYLRSKDDVDFFEHFSIEPSSEGSFIRFSGASNNNCRFEMEQDGNLKRISIKCGVFGIHEKLSFAIDENSFIRELSMSSFKAGIGGHGVPIPLVILKKLNCVF